MKCKQEGDILFPFIKGGTKLLLAVWISILTVVVLIG